MPEIIPVTQESHGGKYWQRASTYFFTREDVICPLHTLEMPRAIMGLPTGFVSIREQFHLVAIQGLRARDNLLVAADGSWQSNYLPENYRYYPFLATDVNGNEKVLCCDAGSGLVFDEPGEGREPFFTTSGVNSKLEDALERLVGFSEQFHRTNGLCDLLASKKLIVPWDIALEKKHPEKLIRGLYCIDENALNRLDAASLAELRDRGALLLAYCQLLSMRHIQGLLLLLKRRQESRKADEDLGFNLDDTGGSISFDHI